MLAKDLNRAFPQFDMLPSGQQGEGYSQLVTIVTDYCYARLADIRDVIKIDTYDLTELASKFCSQAVLAFEMLLERGTPTPHALEKLRIVLDTMRGLVSNYADKPTVELQIHFEFEVRVAHANGFVRIFAKIYDNHPHTFHHVWEWKDVGYYPAASIDHAACLAYARQLQQERDAAVAYCDCCNMES